MRTHGSPRLRAAPARLPALRHSVAHIIKGNQGIFFFLFLDVGNSYFTLRESEKMLLQTRNADSIRRFAAILCEELREFWKVAEVDTLGDDIPVYRRKTVVQFLNNPRWGTAGVITIYTKVFDRDIGKDIERPVDFYGNPRRWTPEEFCAVLRPQGVVR